MATDDTKSEVCYETEPPDVRTTMSTKRSLCNDSLVVQSISKNAEYMENCIWIYVLLGSE